MRWVSWLIVGSVACALQIQLTAQTVQNPLAIPSAKLSSKSAVSKPASALVSQFKAYTVRFGKDGKEDLEPASHVSPGDVIEYVAVHRNVSQKRLLRVDFAIPIHWGTTLWLGSVQPDSGKLVVRPSGNQKSIGNQVSWRIQRIDPGETVEFKLRVSIDPDPSLKPEHAPNPWTVKRPALRAP